jgi:hypothetical protein
MFGWHGRHVIDGWLSCVLARSNVDALSVVQARSVTESSSHTILRAMRLRLDGEPFGEVFECLRMWTRGVAAGAGGGRGSRGGDHAMEGTPDGGAERGCSRVGPKPDCARLPWRMAAWPVQPRPASKRNGYLGDARVEN